MKITRTGCAWLGDIMAHTNPGEGQVVVTWEETLPTIDMADALSIVARGGRVQWVADSDGEDLSASNHMCPDEDGWIELRPGCRYVEVKPATIPMSIDEARARLGHDIKVPF